MRQAHADTLLLVALHGAVGVEQAAQEAAAEFAGALLQDGRDALVARGHADFESKIPERAECQTLLATTGNRIPADEIGAVRQCHRRCQRLGHQRMDAMPAIGRTVHDCCRQPRRQHGLVFLQRAIADQQAQQIALFARVWARPGRCRAVIVQQHAITGRELPDRAPLGLGSPAREACDAPHPVVGSQTQLVTFGGFESHDGPGRGLKEALRAGGMNAAVDARQERPANQFRDLARPVRRVDPGIGRDTGVGGANVFAPPVVVHFVDAVDQHEARLREIVGGCHDDVPQAPRRQRLVHAAGDQAVLVGHVALGIGPLAPHETVPVLEIVLLGVVFARRQREGEQPLAIAAHGLDELIGHQQRQVELPQPAVLTLGADEVDRVRVTDVEGAHLCAAPAARRGNGEAHAVVDIHERHRPGGVRAGA